MWKHAILSFKTRFCMCPFSAFLSFFPGIIRPFLGIHSLSYAEFLLCVIFFWIFGKVLNLFEQKTCFVMLPPTHFLILYYFNNFPETVLDINCFPLIPFSFHAPFNSSVKTFAKSSLRWMLFAIFLGVKPSSLISVEVRFLDARTCFPVAKLTDSSVLAFLVLVKRRRYRLDIVLTLRFRFLFSSLSFLIVLHFTVARLIVRLVRFRWSIPGSLTIIEVVEVTVVDVTSGSWRDCMLSLSFSFSLCFRTTSLAFFRFPFAFFLDSSAMDT